MRRFRLYFIFRFKAKKIALFSLSFEKCENERRNKTLSKKLWAAINIFPLRLIATATIKDVALLYNCLHITLPVRVANLKDKFIQFMLF
jgi:hypothetical protein